MTSKKQRRKDLKKAMDMEIREHKSTFIVYLVIRAIVIAVMIRQLFMGNYENVFMCALTLLLLIIPSFIQVQFKIDLPDTLEIIILMFIFAAEILGEVNEFYIKNTFLGYYASYNERLPGRGHRLFHGQFVE